MRMKALGTKRMKFAKMILRLAVVAALIAIPAMSAVADGPGQVPYPPGGSIQAAGR